MTCKMDCFTFFLNKPQGADQLWQLQLCSQRVYMSSHPISYSHHLRIFTLDEWKCNIWLQSRSSNQLHLIHISKKNFFHCLNKCNWISSIFECSQMCNYCLKDLYWNKLDQMHWKNMFSYLHKYYRNPRRNPN